MKGTELKFNLQALGVAGFILPNGRKPTLLRWCWVLTVQIPYIFIHILAMIEFLVKPFEIRLTLVTMFLANNGFQTNFKAFHMIWYKKRVEELLNLIDTPPNSESQEFNEAERGMRNHSRKRIFRFSLLLCMYNTVVFLGILIPGIIRTIKVAYCDDKRHLNLEFCAHESTPLFVYNYWWFTDIFALPAYYYAYLFNLLMVLAYLAIYSTSDAFVCSAMVAVAERCKLLVRMAPEALMPGENGEITPLFKAWIKYHQHYQILVQKINNVLGPVIFVTHVFAALNAMCYSYIAITDKEESVRRQCTASLIGLAIQMYLFAYAGQQIISKSDELSRATFNAAQVSVGALEEGPARSALLIIMARSCGEHTEQVTGLGYFALSMRFYSRIMSISTSYLLFMLQLQ